jgi:hypothetical protein
MPAVSTAADIGHFGRHHGHELDIGVERQGGHVDNRAVDMRRIDALLRRIPGTPGWEACYSLGERGEKP